MSKNTIIVLNWPVWSLISIQACKDPILSESEVNLSKDKNSCWGFLDQVVWMLLHETKYRQQRGHCDHVTSVQAESNIIKDLLDDLLFFLWAQTSGSSSRWMTSWRIPLWGLAQMEVWSSAWSTLLTTLIGWRRAWVMWTMTTSCLTAPVSTTAGRGHPWHGWLFFYSLMVLRSDWTVHSPAGDEAAGGTAPTVGVSGLWSFSGGLPVHGGVL